MDARLDPEMDEKEDKTEPTFYVDNDPDDNVIKATERLYKQPKTGLFAFFTHYLRCFTHSSDDALPELEDSYAEPLPPNYNTLKNGKKIGM